MVDSQFAGRRTFESLMIAFGAIALLLATMGVYGVTSFFVSQRTQELGLRVALGADPARLLALVLRSSAGMAIAGALVGLAGAFLAARWLSHTLYGVGTGDPYDLRRRRGPSRRWNARREHGPGESRRARRPDDDAARRLTRRE